MMMNCFFRVLFIALLITGTACEQQGTVSGVVIDADGPLAGVRVRIQATDNATVTDSRGLFTLQGLAAGETVTISAWKEAYYCAQRENVRPPARNLRITLVRYQTEDNPDYEWIAPAGDDACQNCHDALTDIWLANAHAGSAVNQRFLTMYNGTDVDGNQSPQTEFVTIKDYGPVPLAPDLDKPYYGPGYKLDFPDTDGNCAACHLPGAALDDPYGIDPNMVTGADAFGIHCDYCHKVADVLLDNTTGLPPANMPGVLSSDVRRPFTDDPERPQLFFGTFDDVHAAAGDTYLPLIEESRFCAPCHFGSFWDTLVYNSYGEWLESPYSDPETGMSCQQCHMPSPTIYQGEELTNLAPDNGGLERDPATIHAHLQRGALDEAFLQEAVSLQADAVRDNGTITVTVTIVNDNTGHHVPTDSPLRHLILLVQAVDENGADLALHAGETLPAWCGEGEPSEGYYGGLPGKAYAKVLEELWTGLYPTGAYWMHTRVRSDNRLAAFSSDTSTYRFTMPEESTVDVTVTLLFRRAYIALQDWKGWRDPDIVMAEERMTVE